MSIVTGECYRVDTTTDSLTDDDYVKYEKEIKAADHAEIKNFVHHGVFQVTRKTLYQKLMDCTWVRKWKVKRDSSGRSSRIIKSRLCCRGFLDPQRGMLAKHSTTATRLSQKLLVSDSANHQWCMESWDVGSAFLQGFSFANLRRACDMLKVPMPDVQREVHIIVPDNVWFHLQELGFAGAPRRDYFQYCIKLLKAMYGLVDAPLLWQLSLRYFLVFSTGARCSHFDENYYLWYDDEGKLIGEATAHVDDGNFAGTNEFLRWCHEKLERRFGKLAVQKPPMTHVGIVYENVDDGYYLQQKQFALAIPLIDIDPERNKKVNAALTPRETTALRQALGALLYLCFTRVDLSADVCVLQQHTKSAVIAHLRQANTIIRRAHRDCDIGLWYRKINPPYKLFSVSDASHASSKTSYAVEGTLVLLMHDKASGIEKGKHDSDKLNGVAHILVHGGKRSKRISHSTSHAESLAMHATLTHCELISMRFTERVFVKAPTLQDLIDADSDSRLEVPIDAITDCNDLYELITGMKGVPQDRSQRLIIMSLREKRMIRKLRNIAWCDTNDMAANSLTKHDLNSEVFYMLLRNGVLKMKNTIKVTPKIAICDPNYSEDDLIALREA